MKESKTLVMGRRLELVRNLASQPWQVPSHEGSAGLNLALSQVLHILGKVVLGGATPAGTTFNPQVNTGSLIRAGLSAAELLVPLRNKIDV